MRLTRFVRTIPGLAMFALPGWVAYEFLRHLYPGPSEVYGAGAVGLSIGVLWGVLGSWGVETAWLILSGRVDRQAKKCGECRWLGVASVVGECCGHPKVKPAIVDFDSPACRHWEARAHE